MSKLRPRHVVILVLIVLAVALAIAFLVLLSSDDVLRCVMPDRSSPTFTPVCP